MGHFLGSGRGLGEICLKTAYPMEWDESNLNLSNGMKVSLEDGSKTGEFCEKVTVFFENPDIIKTTKGSPYLNEKNAYE